MDLFSYLDSYKGKEKAVSVPTICYVSLSTLYSNTMFLLYIKLLP